MANRIHIDDSRDVKYHLQAVWVEFLLLQQSQQASRPRGGAVTSAPEVALTNSLFAGENVNFQSFNQKE